MKRIIMGALALYASTAFAADLPSTKGPLFVAPAPIWTGLYGGVEAGYAWSNNSNVPMYGYTTGFAPARVLTPYALGSMANININDSGFIAGGQLGYRYQAGNWVLGVEGAWDALVGPRKVAAFAGPSIGIAPSVAELGSAWRWAASFDPTVGFLITPTFMVYGGGGLALAQLDRSIVSGTVADITSGSGTSGKVLAGWNAKIGAEVMFAPGWSAGIEGRYFNFGKQTASLSGVAYGAPLPVFTPSVSYLARGHADAFSVVLRINRQLDFFANPFVPLTGDVRADVGAFNRNVSADVQSIPTRARTRVAAVRKKVNVPVPLERVTVSQPAPAK